MSDRLVLAESFVTFGALVLMIVAARDAEGNQAAAHPAAEQAEDQAGDPGHKANF